MTDRFIGCTDYFIGQNSASIDAATNQALDLWISQGLKDGQIIDAARYLRDEEGPHVLAIPAGHQGRFLLYIDTDLEPPEFHAAVEVDQDQLTIEELRQIITAPGERMSPGDYELLAQLDSG